MWYKVKSIQTLLFSLSGISRSAFFIIAYLMSSCNLSLQISLNILRNQRNIARPNQGFLRFVDIIPICPISVTYTSD